MRAEGTGLSQFHTLPELWEPMRQVQAVDEDSEILGQPASLKPEKTIHGAGVPGWEAIAHLRCNHDAGVYQETHGEV